MAFKTLQEVRELVEASLANAQSELAKFRDKFDKNPGNAFDWAGSYFIDAVRVEELSSLLHGFKSRDENVANGEDTRTDEEVLAFLATYYRDQMINSADRVSASSSATRNLMDDYRRAYKVTLYKLFNGQHFEVSL